MASRGITSSCSSRKLNSASTTAVHAISCVSSSAGWREQRECERPLWSSVAGRAGAIKAAARRSAVAPQRGGASLDRTCTPSPFSLWPGRRNGATTEPRNWGRGGADPTYHGRNVPIAGAMAPSDLEQPLLLFYCWNEPTILAGGTARVRHCASGGDR